MKNTEQQTGEFHSGYPRRKGWYKCRIDGEEAKLYLFVCELNPKKRHWTDEQGRRIDEEVEWTED